MQSTKESLAVLAVQFTDHKENEEKWQKRVEDKIDAIIGIESRVTKIQTDLDNHLVEREWSLKKATITLAVVTIILNVFLQYVKLKGG
jgi:hypothetical protein